MRFKKSVQDISGADLVCENGDGERYRVGRGRAGLWEAVGCRGRGEAPSCPTLWPVQWTGQGIHRRQLQWELGRELRQSKHGLMEGSVGHVNEAVTEMSR